MEIPEISMQKLSFPNQYYATVNLQALEILTSSEVKELSLSIRSVYERKC